MVVLPPSFEFPPTNGSVPPALAIDFHHKHNPHHTFAVLYDPVNTKQTRITYEQLACAAHRVAHILNPDGEIPQGTNVGFLVSTSSIEYVVLILGAMRAGLVPFPISPRVNPSGIAHLLTTTRVGLIVTGGNGVIDSTITQLVTTLNESNYSVKFIDLSSLGDIPSLLLVPEAQFKPFPSLEPVERTSVTSILHSSGSTGTPKAIKYHLDGVFKNIINQPIGWAFSGPSAQVGTMALPTFHCMAWAHDDNAISILKPMKGILFGGGPLTDVVGNKLIDDGITIYPLYGATEVGLVNVAPPQDQAGDRLWNYIKLSPRTSPRLVPQNDRDNTFELVFETGDSHYPFVLNSELNGKVIYRTKDLLTPHPSRSNLWKFVGRVDDRIVLLNGEKANPGHMEAEITKCPIQANQVSATHSRLDKRAVIFVDPAQPLPRTPKATIPRSAVLKLYEPDIEEMYAALESELKEDILDEFQWPEDWTDVNAVSAWISGLVKEILGRTVDKTVDLFHQGMDSLTATILLRELKTALYNSQHDSGIQACAQALSQTVIFDNPTIEQLACFLSKRCTGPIVSYSDAIVLESIHATIRKYDSDWPDRFTGKGLRFSDIRGEHVVVTGTTGALGSHLLAQLLASDKIERVWAMNRNSNGDTRDRQRASFEDKMLDVELLASKKLVYVDAVLEEVSLGLADELYNEITSTTTVIIHNAWQVNFNLTLQSFEPNIQATRNLLSLAFSSTARTGLPRFVFASSIAVAGGFSGLGGYQDEVSVRPEDAVSTTGYGQSKLVAEKLLESARQAGLQTCIIRLGQLTGDTKSGSWNTTDWVPSIITSSVSVGCLPAAVGTVSWLPLDVASRSIIDTCTTDDEELPPIIHASHPRPVPWENIMSTFSTLLAPLTGSTLPLVEFGEWNKRVTESAANFQGSDVDRYMHLPSTKIQSTIDGIVRADQQLWSHASDEGVESTGTVRLLTGKAERMSEGLRNAPRLGVEHVERWIRYWEEKGLFV